MAETLIGSRIVNATKFVRSMRGRSLPSLVECDDGSLYVLKILGNGLGANTLANEMIGSTLAVWLGLPTPGVVRIRVSRQFAEENEMGQARPDLKARWPIDENTHFGRAYVGGMEGWRRCIWHVPERSFGHAEEGWDWVGVDLLRLWGDSKGQVQIAYTQKVNNRQFAPTILGFGQMFGGPRWEFRAEGDRWHKELSALRASSSPDVMQWWALKLGRSVPSALRSILPSIPSSWFSGSMADLESTLLSRLDRLTDEISA